MRCITSRLYQIRQGLNLKKPTHHHLSHRYYLRDHRIVYHHQSTYLFIPNTYSTDQNSHSQFINLFVTSLHLYEFNPIILTNIESNAHVIIECERTRTTTNVIHYLQQPLSVILDIPTHSVLESGWVFFY